jgi:hypothetical protein
MGNLGASVGGVADNFLKAYTTIQQNSRANEEAERLKAALALEQAQAEKERQAVAEWIKAQQANKTQKTGFLETPTGKPVNSNLKAFEMTLPAGTPDAQVNQVASGLANKQIPIPQGGGQFGMMSDQNDLKDLYMKLGAINPRKYLPLLQKDDSSADKIAAMLMMQNMRGEFTNRRLDEMERHNKAIEEDRKTRTDASTDKDDDYNSYVQDMKDAGKKPLSRYRFNLWKKITEKRFTENPIAAAQRDALTGKDGKPLKIEF